MRVKANEPVECTIPMPAGPTALLGARIEVPLSDVVAVPWVAATLSSERRLDENGEPYTQWLTSVTLDSPAEGDYLIAWLSAEDDAPVVARLPLHVLPA